MKGLLKNKEKYELLTLANKANVEPQKTKKKSSDFICFMAKSLSKDSIKIITNTNI